MAVTKEAKFYLLDGIDVSIAPGVFEQQCMVAVDDLEYAQEFVGWCEANFQNEWAWVQLQRINHYYGRKSYDEDKPNIIERMIGYIDSYEVPFILWFGCSNKDAVLFKLKWGGNVINLAA